MARHELDTRGLKCPTPTLKMTTCVLSRQVQKGDVLAVFADCATFERDVREWCKTMHKVLIVFREHSNGLRCAEVLI